MIISNAIITSTALRLDRDCFLCAWLFLDYGDSTHQGFGGHVLGGLPDVRAGYHRKQPNMAAEAIVTILRVADVDDWSKVAGKAVRVRRTVEGFASDIIAVGHITKDIWYEPGTFKDWTSL